MLEFLDMGHHTFYVWLAYGVSLFALCGLSFQACSAKRNALTRVTRKIDRLNSLR